MIRIIQYSSYGLASILVAFGIWSLRSPKEQSANRNFERLTAWIAIVLGISLVVGALTGNTANEFSTDLSVARKYFLSLNDFLRARGAYHATLERHEFATNTLDLVSFLLVTPEIVKNYESNPLLSRVSAGIVLSLLALGIAILPWLFISALIFSGAANHQTVFPRSIEPGLMRNAFSLSLLLTSLSLMAILFLARRFVSLPSEESTKRGLVFLGILVFIASRIIGLMAAIVAG